MPQVKKETTKKLSRTRGTSLSIPVYSLAGRATGTYVLPKEIFGAKVNKSLLSQAMRVYMTNQKTLPGFTKTRGEVQGSTAKIYRQKGTGRARHGAIRAPIFVGGGITFGPKPRKVRLELPQRMKKAALYSALSSKLLDKNVIGLTGVERASGKTKEIAQLLVQLNSKIKNKQSLRSNDLQKSKILSSLIVTDGKADKVVRAVRNIPAVDVLPANLINAYEVLRHELLLVTKKAIEKLAEGTTRGTSTPPEARLARLAAKQRAKGGTSTTGNKTRDTRDTRQSRDTLSI